jgi:transcriptional regulator GlxA family with amidase domain
MATVRIAILAYPGCFASEVFGVLDVLTIGRHVAAAGGASPADWGVEVVGVRPSPRVRASGGVTLGAGPPTGAPDVVVVPGFELAGPATDVPGELARLAPEIAFVRSAHAQGAQVVSVCVGAFLLAEAGLLDGRRATTSWLFARDLAERSPTTEVVAEELVVRDGGVTTTAAFSAMYDFTLQLLAEQRGADVARRTARIALLDDARGSQTPYVDGELLPPAGNSFGAGVQRWLRHHLDEPFDLRRVAAEFSVSPRTLTRRFAAETGQSALRYLQSQRVRRAQHLLATTQQPVAEVARRVGYGDAATFSQLFRRTVGLSPRDYRAQFGAGGRQLG